MSRCSLTKEAASGASEANASLFRVLWSSFPRRQQAWRLRRAAASGSAAIVAGAFAATIHITATCVLCYLLGSLLTAALLADRD